MGGALRLPRGFNGTHAVGSGAQSPCFPLKDVAAVLACAAIEDALKRYASVNNIDSSNKAMQEAVNSLKSTGLVNGAQKTLLDAMSRVRELAMHADLAKLAEPDVNSVIGFVEQFLLTKFSDG